MKKIAGLKMASNLHKHFCLRGLAIRRTRPIRKFAKFFEKLDLFVDFVVRSGKLSHSSSIQWDKNHVVTNR